jgi:hypothetical protein
MKRTALISLGVILIALLGFLLPPLVIPPAALGAELQKNYQGAVEPFGALLRTAKILHGQDDRYGNRCADKGASVLLQSYTWMLIPGPVIEACVILSENGEITGLKSIGAIARHNAPSTE